MLQVEDCVLLVSRILWRWPRSPTGQAQALRKLWHTPPIPISASSWQHPSAWDTFCGTCPLPHPPVPCHMGNLGAWGPFGLGAWLPQQWQLSRVWGPGPEGTASWARPLLSRTRPWRGKSFLKTCPFMSGQRITLVRDLQERVTWPPEQGIWHWDFYNHSSCPSLPSPWKGFSWEFEMFLIHKPPLSLHGPQ